MENAPSGPRPIIGWQQDRRATKNHIREAIREAIANKTEAVTWTPEQIARACTYIQNEWERMRRTSIKTLARENLTYWRNRAYLRSDRGFFRVIDRHGISGSNS